MMRKLYLLILALGFVSLNAQDVNFTFRVNMNATDDYIERDSVWVVMDGDDAWNFTEYYGMEETDVDGIYAYTFPVASGGAEVVQQYSFAYGLTADNYTGWETPPEECRNDNWYREIIVPADQGDTILPAFFYGKCTDVAGNSVTFHVDLSEVTDLYEGGGVWVNINGDWTDWYDMTDDNGDKIYDYTATYLEGEEVKYLFSYQTGADPDNDLMDETVPAECSTDGLRTFTVGSEDMVLPAVKFGECLDLVDITYQVDMSDVNDLQGAVWVNINGDWTDWYDMVDAGSGIYTITKSYQPGDVYFYLYSYQNGPSYDNDYLDETVPEACGGTFGVRRLLVGNADANVPVVKFGACPDDPSELVTVTFSVDVANETVGDKSVYQVIKSPWYWNQLSSSGDDIYTGSVSIHAGQMFPYTFLIGEVDEWDGEEWVPAECNFGTEIAPERMFEGTMKDSVMPVIVFGACLDVSDKYNITYQVDMSSVADLYEGGAVWVNVNGDWTDWYDMTDDNADMIYEYTMAYSEGEELMYIFSYQNGADPNNDYLDETVPSECATDGVRTYTVGTSDATIDVVSLGSCTHDETGVENLSAGTLKMYPNPASDQLTIQLQDVESGIVTVLDMSGREIISRRFANSGEITLSVENLVPEFYVVSVVTETRTLRAKLLIK
jgi:hypothetical protein